MHINMTIKASRKVSFATTQEAYCNPPCLEEQKESSWYSQQDLTVSREDVRKAMEALHQVEGNLEMIDQTQICLRGIEKYADLVQKVVLQRRHSESVLRQQDTNRETRSKSGADHIALISRLLSQPFKDVALYYAAQNALHVQEEDEKHMPVTAEQQAEVTLYNEKVQLFETEAGDVMEYPDTVDVMEYPDAQLGLKRARLGSFDETNLRRNVKPCLQSSE
jgi:hypothetical protein